ncbi:MAG TPA: peptidylprolyl isomerase [Candidatus Binatia bacterium]|nr:peptidylprolyl isomerase [Candidatus Binatia bacterium]
MNQAKHGDTVRVHYRGKLQDGSVFDASDREPVQFTIGEGHVIEGFEEAVVGMNPGESKTTELPAEKAFGLYREDLVVVVPKNQFASWDLDPTVGERVPIPQRQGPPIEVIVTEVTESDVTVDANHPLAGEDLTLDIELVDIVYGAH